MAKKAEGTTKSRRDGKALSARQTTILEMIRAAVTERGYPPSIREIGDAVGLTSPSSVAYQLHVLEEKGYIRRDPHRPRAMEVLSPGATPVRRRTSAPADATADDTEASDFADLTSRTTMVPVLGRIAAGGPILAEDRKSVV